MRQLEKGQVLSQHVPVAKVVKYCWTCEIATTCMFSLLWESPPLPQQGVLTQFQCWSQSTFCLMWYQLFNICNITHVTKTRIGSHRGCQRGIWNSEIPNMSVKQQLLILAVHYIHMGIFFFFLAMLRGLKHLSSQLGMQPGTPSVEVRSPNHWTTREFPTWRCFKNKNDVGLPWWHSG